MDRKEIAKNTLDIIDQGFYTNYDLVRIDISLDLTIAEKNSVLYKPPDFEHLFEKFYEVIYNKHNFPTLYEVTGETTLECMERLTAIEDNLMCLNFASAKNPGGGFMSGAQAQEESLARSSGLYYCISQRSMMYSVNRHYNSCSYTDHMIYSPSIPFFKNDNGELLSKPYLSAVLTAPAVNAGVVKQQENSEAVSRIDEAMLSRTEKVLTLAALHGHRTIVLGAWGCGVFRNSPEKVAGYFHYHLKENPKFNGVFKKIVFAILDNTSRQTTITPFKQKFGIYHNEKS